MNPSSQTTETTQAESKAQRSAHFSIRMLYFFFFAGMGIFFAYINVYYLNIGLSGMQIGILGTIGPLVGVFSSILWGLVSDRFGRPRLLFSIAAVGVLVAIAIMANARIFIWFIPPVILLSIFSSPLPAMMDSTTFRLLGSQPERFGRYRIFGTLGFITTSSLSGFLLERTGLSALFWVYGLTVLFYLLATSGLPNTPIHLHTSPFAGVRQLIRQPMWVLFAASTFVLWIGSTGAISFVGVLIKSLGGSERLIGLNWAVAAAIELPVMWSSAFLLSRLGAPRLVTIAFLGYFIRILFYGLIPTPEWALAVNIIHAFSYVPFLIGSAAYANQLAPPALKATSQGLLFAVMNLGNVFGSLISGYLYDHLGITGLFRTLAFVALAGFVLFTTGRFLLDRHSRSGPTSTITPSPEEAVQTADIRP